MMKFLLLAVLLVVAYMFWRQARITRNGDAAPPPPRPPQLPQEMVACAACGLHLPQADALVGKDGLPYCSPEHRLRAGG